MRPATLLTILAATICFAGPDRGLAQTAGLGTTYLKPQYLPPAQLARVLGVRDVRGHDLVEWTGADGAHAVEVRRNDAANLLILTGAAADVDVVRALAREVDIPPRQIAIEARIVEVDESRARDAGIDWSALRADLSGNFAHQRRSPGEPANYDAFTWTANTGLFSALKLLDEKGAATIRNAPRILTLNNQPAQILDGQRVTYITRYSSFTNLFATDSMDAGLRLNVLPSLGESGYLTLQIRAELTSLGSNISGSPVKDGQMVENTVVVKDGDSVLLGGFTRTTDERTRRRFPVLGTVLPFLFSREISTQRTRESFVVLTPRVVDLTGALDDRTRGLMQEGPRK
jgi:type II secretory pathway component GspD/PulD (secretin)